MSRIKMNLTHKSLEDLHRMRVELDADLASVKMQLSEARRDNAVTLAFDNPEWFNRATRAERVMGAKHQQVLAEISKRKRLQTRRNAEVFEAAFIQVARETLDQEVFSSLVEATQLRLG